VEIGASLVAGAEALELVEPGEGALYDPAHLAESGTAGDAAWGDHRLGAALPQQAAVLVEVIAPVSEQPPGPAARASSQTADRWDRVQERYELVTSCERDGQRRPVPVDDHMVLGAGAGTVERRGADVISPFE
jgi:hypothetical protein